jgi:hypothetical protein
LEKGSLEKYKKVGDLHKEKRKKKGQEDERRQERKCFRKENEGMI